jgi:hypothetical protein
MQWVDSPRQQCLERKRNPRNYYFHKGGNLNMPKKRKVKRKTKRKATRKKRK